MIEKYVMPKFDAPRFNCPHCGAFAQQKWYVLPVREKLPDEKNYVRRDEVHASLCMSCYKCSFWYMNNMIYPTCSTAPLPVEEMPEDVKDDFMEARNVVNISPRSAAALLRLALQRLMIHLEEKGKDLDDDIGSLVEKGLPERIQQALDSVRVIGNEAVHPGQIDLRDNIEIAISLFDLMNLIVEDRITKEKKIRNIYEKLPDTKIKHIEKRDKKDV